MEKISPRPKISKKFVVKKLEDLNTSVKNELYNFLTLKVPKMYKIYVQSCGEGNGNHNKIEEKKISVEEKEKIESIKKLIKSLHVYNKTMKRRMSNFGKIKEDNNFFDKGYGYFKHFNSKLCGKEANVPGVLYSNLLNIYKKKHFKFNEKFFNSNIFNLNLLNCTTVNELIRVCENLSKDSDVNFEQKQNKVLLYLMNIFNLSRYVSEELTIHRSSENQNKELYNEENLKKTHEYKSLKRQKAFQALQKFQQDLTEIEESKKEINRNKKLLTFEEQKYKKIMGKLRRDKYQKKCTMINLDLKGEKKFDFKIPPSTLKKSNSSEFINKIESNLNSNISEQKPKNSCINIGLKNRNFKTLTKLNKINTQNKLLRFSTGFISRQKKRKSTVNLPTLRNKENISTIFEYKEKYIDRLKILERLKSRNFNFTQTQSKILNFSTVKDPKNHMNLEKKKKVQRVYEGLRECKFLTNKYIRIDDKTDSLLKDYYKDDKSKYMRLDKSKSVQDIFNTLKKTKRVIESSSLKKLHLTEKSSDFIPENLQNELELSIKKDEILRASPHEFFSSLIKTQIKEMDV